MGTRLHLHFVSRRGPGARHRHGSVRWNGHGRGRGHGTGQGRDRIRGEPGLLPQDLQGPDLWEDIPGPVDVVAVAPAECVCFGDRIRRSALAPIDCFGELDFPGADSGPVESVTDLFDNDVEPYESVAHWLEMCWHCHNIIPQLWSNSAGEWFDKSGRMVLRPV